MTGDGGVAFGSRADRFSWPNSHPGTLDPSVVQSLPREQRSQQRQKLGPGYYSPTASGKKDHSTVSLEDRILLQRQRNKESKRNDRIGPGYYDMTSFIDHLDKKISSTRGSTSFEQRFKRRSLLEKVAGNIPGPGSYEIQIPNKHVVSVLGVCDSSIGERFPYIKRIKLGPSYNYKSFTQEILERRGPFISMADRFTEKQDKFRSELGPGQYGVVSFTDELSDKSKGKHGKFAQLSRFSPQERASTAPGPGSYDPCPPTTPRASTAAPPFGRGARRFIPLLSRMVDVNSRALQAVTPGPGFYQTTSH